MSSPRVTMHPRVRETLYEVLKQPEYEGTVLNMYLDRIYLVTIGIGFLIDDSKSKDPVLPALRLPFKYKNGSEIPKEKRESVIRNEWKKVKGLTHLAGSSAAFGEHTNLRLAANMMLPLYNSKIDGYVKDILQVDYFSEFPTWPADAQLGLLSMVYAGGIGLLKKEYTKFMEACYDKNFLKAANECEFATTPRPYRNAFDRECFENAAFVLQSKDLPSSRLLYPAWMPPMLWPGVSDEKLEEIYTKYPKLRSGYKLFSMPVRGKFFKELYKKFPELKPSGKPLSTV